MARQSVVRGMGFDVGSAVGCAGMGLTLARQSVVREWGLTLAQQSVVRKWGLTLAQQSAVRKWGLTLAQQSAVQPAVLCRSLKRILWRLSRRLVARRREKAHLVNPYWIGTG